MKERNDSGVESERGDGGKIQILGDGVCGPHYVHLSTRSPVGTLEGRQLLEGGRANECSGDFQCQPQRSKYYYSPSPHPLVWLLILIIIIDTVVGKYLR
jgi:hypothetical protein